MTVVPNLMAALWVRTVGYCDRRAQQDALNVWRLLEAYRLAVPSPTQWPQSGSAGDAAKIFRRDFGPASGNGVRAASSSRQTGLEFADWCCMRWDHEVRACGFGREHGDAPSPRCSQPGREGCRAGSRR